MTTSYKMRSMPAANRTLMMEICFDSETYIETVKLYYPVDCSHTTARHGCGVFLI